MNVLDCIGMNLDVAIEALKENFPNHKITKNWVESHDDLLRMSEIIAPGVIVVGYRPDTRLVVNILKA